MEEATHSSSLLCVLVKPASALAGQTECGQLLMKLVYDAWIRYITLDAGFRLLRWTVCCPHLQDGGFSRVCTSSGRVLYPRVDPAIITLVTAGDDWCLLGRKAGWPTGRWCPPCCTWTATAVASAASRSAWRPDW